MVTGFVPPMITLFCQKQNWTGPIPVQHATLFDLPARLFPIPLTGQRLFGPLFFSWFQVEGMSFDFLNDVLLLHFTLKTPQSILQGLTFLELHFRQRTTPPHWTKISALCTEGTDIIGG